MTLKHSSPAAAPTRRALYLVETAALEQSDLSPRRYHVVERGRRVLVGLSAEETLEFEKLEQSPPLDDNGLVAWSSEGAPITVREKRWLELYIKHDGAWKRWIAENKGR
jgi:hypothetical protein